MIKDFRDIIDIWDTRKAFAEQFGLKNQQHASVWWQRNMIPSDYWIDVAAAAAAKGRADVTTDLMAKFDRDRRRKKRVAA